MFWHVVAAIGVLLYFAGEGITEGFTFASESARKTNKIIRNEYADKESAGALSYHMVRVFIENLGMVLMIIAAFFIKVNIFKFTWYMLGWTGVGVFIYERLFNIVSYGIMFPQKSPYDLNKWITFRRTWKLDVWILGIGILLLVLYFMFKV